VASAIESNRSRYPDLVTGRPRTLGIRVFGLFMNMDKAIGGDLQKGLAALKTIVEGTTSD